MLEVRFSSTETFLQCRRRYDYEYKERLTRIRTGIIPVTLASIGSAFHAGVQAYYGGEDPGRALDDYFSEHDFAGQTVKVGKNEVDAILCVRGLYNRYLGWAKYSGYDDGREIVDLEKRLEWELIPGVKITGQPDKVSRDQYGQLYIDDYKTVGVYTKFDDYADKNRQGLTYTVLAEHFYGQTVAAFTLLQVHRSPPKANPIAVDPLVSYFTAEQKAEHIENLKLVLSEIKDMHYSLLPVYPHPSDLCKWCPFRDLCYAQSAEPDTLATVRERFHVKGDDET